MNFSRCFYSEIANFQGLRSACITFDVDFAPDYMIKNVADIIHEYGAKATFFATHDSEYLKTLDQDANFEIGIHPNLAPDSTQGNNLDDIVIRLKKSYPNAVSNRFHKLNFQYSDYSVLHERGILYDVSSLQYNQQYVLPVWQPDVSMMFMTYVWEDGICENAGLPMDIEGIDLMSPGIKILNFHPMNAYINVGTQEERLQFLKCAGQLTSCSQDVADGFRSTGPGSETVLRQCLQFMNKQRVIYRTISDIGKTFQEEMRPYETL